MKRTKKKNASMVGLQPVMGANDLTLDSIRTNVLATTEVCVVAIP